MREKPTGLKTRNLGLQFCETDRAFWTQYKVSKNRLGRFFATRWLGIRRDAVARSTKRVNKNWISELLKYDGSGFAKSGALHGNRREAVYQEPSQGEGTEIICLDISWCI